MGRSAVRRSGGQRRPPARQGRAQRPPLILIADDTVHARELYAEYFGSRGFTVVTADDGTRTVEVALQHIPDVMVIDLAMPQIDGLTAIRRIRADPRLQWSHIIVLTGYPEASGERAARDAGADLFLTKPCLPDVLEKHANRLRRSRRRLQRDTA